jgi:hypothetical protein
MKWTKCIKELKGQKVITCKGDEAVIEAFDLKCKQLGYFIGKYQVSFVNSPAVGWYTRNQLTFLNTTQ